MTFRPNVHLVTNVTGLPDYRSAEAAAFGTLGWWQCNANISAPQAVCDPSPPGIELPGVFPATQPAWSVEHTKALFRSTPHLLGVAQTDLSTGSGGLFGAATEEDGVFMLFPFRSRPNYPISSISCVHPGYTGPAVKTGFDARCRGWYNAARISNETQFSSPYIFAGSGLLGVTASKAFYNLTTTPPPNGPSTPKEGVCFMDYSFDDVAVIVKARLLESGYGYLVDRTTGSAIVHPALDFANPPPSTKIEAMEFGDSGSKEAQAFVQGILPRIFAQPSGLADFTRSGESEWSLAWRHVQLSPYVLVLTVPRQDVEAPIERVESFMEAFIVGMVAALAVILALVFVCIAAVGRRIMQLVVGPVRELQRLASDIQAGKARLSAERYTLHKPTFEVSRLARALRQLHVLIRVGNARVVEGDEQFAGPMLTEALELFKRLGNTKAIGVCYTNLGAVAMQRRDFKTAVHMYTLAVDNSRAIIAKHLRPEQEALDDGSDAGSRDGPPSALYIGAEEESVADAAPSSAAGRIHSRLASVMEEDIVVAPMRRGASSHGGQLPSSKDKSKGGAGGSASAVASVYSHGVMLDDSLPSANQEGHMRTGLISGTASAADAENPTLSLGDTMEATPPQRRGRGEGRGNGTSKLTSTESGELASAITDEFVISHPVADDDALLTYSGRSGAAAPPRALEGGALMAGTSSSTRADSVSLGGELIGESPLVQPFSMASSGSQGSLGVGTLGSGGGVPAGPSHSSDKATTRPAQQLPPVNVKPFASLPVQPGPARHARFASDVASGDSDELSSSSHSGGGVGSGKYSKATSSAGELPSGADPAAGSLNAGDVWGSRGALAHVMHRANTRMALGGEMGGDASVPVVAALGDHRHAQLLQQLAARQANLAKAYMSRARLLADAALVQRLGGYVLPELEAPLRSLDSGDLAQLRAASDDAKHALNALEHAGRHLTAAVPALQSPADAAAAHAAAAEAFTDAALAAAAYPAFARRVAALARFARASLVRCQLCLDEAMVDNSDQEAKQQAVHMRVLLQRRVKAAEGAALASEGKVPAALQHFAMALTTGTVCSRDFDARVLWAMTRLLLDTDQLESARRTATMAGAHVSGPREFAFVVDNSSSMGEHHLIDIAMDSVLSLYDTYVLPIDRVCLITFTRRAVMRVDPRRKGTGRRAAKTRALMDACRTARGGTACYDGILAAVMQQVSRAASQAASGRRTAARFIVVITDGTDTMSRASSKDTEAIVAQVCKHTPLAVHIVGVGALENEEALRAIAAASSGGQFVPADASRDSIDAAFNHITAAVAEVYVEAV